MTVNDCEDITFTSLGFDANGIGHEDEAYGGGVFFHRCADVRVYDTHSYDSRFQHPDVTSSATAPTAGTSSCTT